MLWREPLPILLRRKVSKGICRALLVEEADVVGYLTGTFSGEVIWKSVKSSALIQPLIASIAELSVGVPALDIDLTMLYMGRSSL